jgi:hypothetical protein
VLGALASAAARASEPLERTEVVSREISVGPGLVEVRVDNTFGAVRVRAGEPGTVAFSIRRTATSRRAEALDRASREITLRVELEETRLELVQDGPFRCVSDGSLDGGGCRWRPDYSVSWDWEVRVPPGIDLEVSTVNGGALEVDGIEGRVAASNVNGPVRLTGLGGAVEARTVNGDLRAELTRAPAVDSSFETLNGDVVLGLPADAAAVLALDSENGEIYTDFDFTPVPQRATAEREMVGRHQYRLDSDLLLEIGGGGPRLYCGTLNGDVVVRAR